MTTAGMTSTSSANFKEHWVTYTAIALTSLALILISLQNFNSPHFQGLFKLGSTSLFALGCVGFLATSAIICCKTPNPVNATGDESHLLGIEDETQPISEPLRMRLSKDEYGYYMLTASEAFRASAILVNEQVLLVKTDKTYWVYKTQDQMDTHRISTSAHDPNVVPELRPNHVKQPGEDLILRAVNARDTTAPKLLDGNRLQEIDNLDDLFQSDEYLEVVVKDGSLKFLQKPRKDQYEISDTQPGCKRITYELLLLRQENLKAQK